MTADRDTADALVERRGMETEVYQPAEDSALLLEAAEEHVSRGDMVLEVGTGSGYVAAELQHAHAIDVVGSDVNPVACRQARDQGVEAVRADLVAPFRAGVFDIVLFNPPYLPEHDFGAREDWMEVALTGGETGRAVIEPFLEDVGRVLAPGGRVLLLASSLSDLDEVEARAADAGFASEELRRETFPFETLVVFGLRREVRAASG